MNADREPGAAPGQSLAGAFEDVDALLEAEANFQALEVELEDDRGAWQRLGDRLRPPPPGRRWFTVQQQAWRAISEDGRRVESLDACIEQMMRALAKGESLGAWRLERVGSNAQLRLRSDEAAGVTVDADVTPDGGCRLRVRHAADRAMTLVGVPESSVERTSDGAFEVAVPAGAMSDLSVKALEGPAWEMELPFRTAP